MTSPIPYGAELDKELDDAALWAAIDSAAASHSATKPRNHLALNNPTPLASPPSTTHLSRPHKMPRTCASQLTPIPMPLARNTHHQRSPEPYLSPQIRNSDLSPRNELQIHSLSGSFPSVSLFKDYQNAAMAILEKTDFTMISGNPFIKKSGWRKISFYFNLSYEIKDKTIEFDENRNVQRAEFVVRAHMQGGRFSDGWGSCERREKRFLKPNHDIPSTAETRAKNKACQDLLGIGEYRPGAGHLQRQN